MEPIETVPEDDDLSESPCIAREECISELLADSPEGCLYCRLSSLDGDDEW